MNAFPDTENDAGADSGYLDALTQDFLPKVKDTLKISIQPKRTGKQILLMAFVNMGLKHYNSTKEKFDYKPVIVSTGLSFPFECWDKKKKKTFGKYAYIMERAEEFKKYAQMLYTNLLEDIKSSVHESDPYETIIERQNTINNVFVNRFKDQIQHHISSKLKETNDIVKGKKISDKRRKNTTPIISIPVYLGAEINGYHVRLIHYVDDKIKRIESQPYYITKIGSETLSNYKRFRNRIADYEKAQEEETEHEFILNIPEITLKTVEEFLSWMIDTGKPEGGDYEESYLGKMKKDFRQIIEKAKGDSIPLHPKMDLSAKKFWGRKEIRAADPFLNFQQLEKIRSLEFGKKPKKEVELINKGELKYVSEEELEIVRDLFIVNCSCGLRWSDFKRLKMMVKENEKYYFIGTNQKTKNKISKIPCLDKYVANLYEKKYNNQFNINFTSGHYNRAIKVLAFRAGFIEDYLISKMNLKTGKIDDTYPPFWQLIKSRTARKTFATNHVLEFYTPISILKTYLGHSSEKMTLKYLQMDESDIYKSQMKLNEMVERLQSEDRKN